MGFDDKVDIYLNEDKVDGLHSILRRTIQLMSKEKTASKLLYSIGKLLICLAGIVEPIEVKKKFYLNKARHV